jgi:hypothetical protein
VGVAPRKYYICDKLKVIVLGGHEGLLETEGNMFELPFIGRFVCEISRTFKCTGVEEQTVLTIDSNSNNGAKNKNKKMKMECMSKTQDERKHGVSAGEVERNQPGG